MVQPLQPIELVYLGIIVFAGFVGVMVWYSRREQKHHH